MKNITFLSIAMASLLVVSCAGGQQKNYGEPVFGTVTDEKPVASTIYGQVSGETRGGVAIFRGIPYGGSVKGAARWKPAAKPESWEGIRECTTNAPVAVQSRFSGSISAGDSGLSLFFNGGHPELFGCADEVKDEDCLALNVVTPGIDAGKRPVLVYFHGGGFSTGSGTLVLGSDKLCREEDIVVVGVNHRLNVFGLLYLGALDPEYSTSGSVGLQDLTLSLEWVRDNIANFGGDPDNVTIMGESGGGMKVSNLLAMPSAKGLFSKAIVESGSTPTCGFSKEAAAAQTEKLLANLGLDKDSWRELLDMDAWQVFDASTGIDLQPVADGDVLPFVEGGTWCADAGKDIPVLVGASADEFGVFLPIVQLAAETTWDNITGKVAALLKVDEAKAQEVVETYKARSGKDVDPWHVLVNIQSMSSFLGGGAFYQALARSTSAPVFSYFIEYDSQAPQSADLHCAWHTADLPLQFRIVYKEETDGLSRQMAHAWAAFARTGTPSTPELEWPAFTSDSRKMMVFDETTSIKEDPNKAVREILDEKTMGFGL